MPNSWTVRIKGEAYTVEQRGTEAKNPYAFLSGSTITICIPAGFGSFRARTASADLLHAIARKINIVSATMPDFYDGERLQVLGKDYFLNIKTARITRARSSIEGNVISVYVPDSLANFQAKLMVHETVKKLVTKRARKEIKEKVDAINAKHFNEQVNKISIKEVRSIWGSNSIKARNITLNFKLLFAPSWILDYVIVHELAHFKVHNHSKEFWNTVSAACPEYKQARKWLKDHGKELGRNNK